MRYSAEWHDDARNAAPEERATVADLRFWIGDQNVVRHLDADAVVDHLTVSAYGLAEGLAHDWWTLFGGRDAPLSLMRYRNGYVVPDIHLSFDGASFEVSAAQREYTNPGIRFWAGPSEVMARPEAEAQLGAIVEDILARLRSRGLDGTSAALRWARVQESRADPDEAAFCDAAGALGLDPYRIDDAATYLIRDAAAQFDGEPLTEFLAGARPFDRRRLIDWVRAVEERPDDTSRLPGLAAAAKTAATTAPARPGEPPWSLGYRRARAFRAALALDASRRFAGFRDLASTLGASPAFASAHPADGIRAVRTHGRDDVHLHLRAHGANPQAEVSQLFTLARAAGDVACFPDPQRAAINDLRQASRQAAGRAFAAEFLAPVDEVLAMRDDGRDMITISSEFSVAPEVVQRQLENAARIVSARAPNPT